MVNPTLGYDTEYNRRLANILSNFDDIEASRNSPTMVIGGMRQRKYINSGNTSYDGREGTAPFSGSMYGGAVSGGVNRLRKAEKWEQFAYDTANDGLKLAKRGKKVFGLGTSGGASSGGAISGGVNRMKKAEKYEQFAVDTANDALKLVKRGKKVAGAKSGGAISGGVNHMKKAKAYEQFAVDTANDALKLVKRGRKVAGAMCGGIGLPKPRATGYGRPNPWIQHIKDTQSKHGVSYKEAMSLAKATYKK